MLPSKPVRFTQIVSSLLYLGVLLAGKTARAVAPAPDQVIESAMTTMGKKTGAKAGGRPQWDLSFKSVANTEEFTLLISHENLLQPYTLEVNGRSLGLFPLSYSAKLETYFRVPAGWLTNGDNSLRIAAPKFGREMSVGNVRLYRQPLARMHHLQPVAVTVLDDATGKPVPARVTIVDGKDKLVEIFNVAETNSAVRLGRLYTPGTSTRFDLSAGKYQFYATRGMEWSLASKSVEVKPGGTTSVELRLRRQVDTKGFVAADTHIHTITFSGHGDASIHERMLTLAGEGVELAIATDHNHHIDYTPFQAELGLNDYFTPVVGNEVTTKNGHINAFPMPANGPVPNHLETNWVRLVDDIRAKGAKVVILNHPRWPEITNNPFANFAFNRASGDRWKGPEFTFDAMELVNSSSGRVVKAPEHQGNPLRLLTDWFALLNRGEKITGVGSSDSHTVAAAVGQGRTYVRSATDDPARINVDEMVRNFLAGDTSVSYGIFAEVSVAGHHPGETLKPKEGQVTVSLRVAAADWVQPRRAIVFLNGLPMLEKKLSPKKGQPYDERLELNVPVPAHDAYLVCAVFGDGVTAPYWRTVGDFTAAITNPVYLDNDGDVQYQNPRETARKLLAATDGSATAAWAQIQKADEALAGQMLGLIYSGRDAALTRQIDSQLQAAAKTREVYQAFLENSPLIVLKSKAVTQ